MTYKFRELEKNENPNSNSLNLYVKIYKSILINTLCRLKLKENIW